MRPERLWICLAYHTIPRVKQTSCSLYSIICDAATDNYKCHLFCRVLQVTMPLLLCSLSSWKNAFEASYVDQQIDAAGAWKSILGIQPLMSPLYPSFFTIVRITSPIEPVLNLSHPQTPWKTKQLLLIFCIYSENNRSSWPNLHKILGILQP